MRRTLGSLVVLGWGLGFVSACSGASDETPGEPTPPAASGGAAGQDGGGAPGVSSCDATWSCWTRSEGLLVTCVERSWGAGEDAEQACEAQAIGDLEFSYSAGPCERATEASGCLVREDARCQVTWLYGEGRDFFEQQCAAQDHEVVGP